jgi:uncharacterized protein YndB with AHSA1/START domain
MLEIALYLAIAAGVALLALVAIASRRPDTFRVARSVHIAAPPQAIFPLINDLRKFATWSPYDRKDPHMARTFSGPESGVGQRYDWDGNANVGKGWLLVSSSSPPSEVGIELHMLKPITGSNQVTFTLLPEDGGTTVMWRLEGPVPLLAKVIHLFIDMDRMCGGDFETGLASLKAVVEGAAATPAQS